MNVAAVGADNLGTRPLLFCPRNRLALGDPGRGPKIVGIAHRVLTVAGFRQPLAAQRVLVGLRPPATCRFVARLASNAERIKVRRETRW